MVARHGIHLAVFLIKSHFGDLVSRVCECLLNRGTLSFQELVRSIELDPANNGRNNLLVKNCLLVLIQHSCVQAFSVPKFGGEGEVVKPLTKYIALLDIILHRLRFAKFLAIVRNDLGPECETLLEGLLQHGRLTFDQLVLRASSKKAEAMRDNLRTSFNRLVHAQYVERCPRPDPFITPNLVGETTSPKGRGSKSGVSPPSTEQQAMLAAALSDAERFCGISNTGTASIIDKKEKETEHYSSVTAGDKRKHEEIDVDNDVQATITENEILWRANFEKFVHCLKKKACVENIRSKFSIDAGIVLEAMIESNCNYKATDINSVTTSMDAILEGVRGKPGGIQMTLEHVRIILEQIGCRLCTEESGALYTIDLKGIIETCQNEEVEFLVLKRYGKEAYRIFRLLVKDGCKKETDQIAATTFVEKKESQGLLYKLWKDDYLDMEKVMVTGGRGGLTYFLWKVKKGVLWEHILNDIYHAALNLSQRAAHMIEQDPEILLPKQALPEQQRKEKSTEQKRWMILQSALAKLDDTLMLFRNF